MSHADFVHLHLHTAYSLLNGTCRLARPLEKALTGFAVCQNGNGAVVFHCHEHAG
jgi:DNA polymerase III alpha subunit